MHLIDADKTNREKARRELRKNAMSHIEKILEPTPEEISAVMQLISNQENYPKNSN